MEQKFGSYDFYRTQLEATGPITCDKSLLFRIDGSYQNNNSFLDIYHNESGFVAPSLTWKIGPSTEANLTYQFYHTRFPYEHGIPAIGDDLFAVPWNRWVGDTGDYTDLDRHALDLKLTHNFNESWRVKGGFQYQNEGMGMNQMYPWDLPQADGTLPRAPWFVDYNKEQFAGYVELNGKVEFAWMKHNLLFGADRYDYTLDTQGFVNGFNQWDTINVFHPRYGHVDYDLLRRLKETSPDWISNGEQDWYGLYLQDQISIGDQIHVLLGGRYDWAERRSFNGSTEASVKDDELSPRVGILYHPFSWISLFGNYTEGLGKGNIGLTFDGKPFEPERAHQFEGGVKLDVISGRLGATVTYFNLTKENILTGDPDHKGYNIAIGEGNSEGLEIDVTGKVTSALNIIASYTYNEATTTKDNRGLEGKRFPLVPYNSGSLWATYDITKEFTMGAGVFVSGDRPGDYQNTFDLPGYTRTDAMARYLFKIAGMNLSLRLNVLNIFDEKYYTYTDLLDGIPKAQLYQGASRTVLGSLKLEY